MLYSLVDGEDGQITGAAEPSGGVERAEVAQHRDRPVRIPHDAIDEVGPGQHELVLRHTLALVTEQRVRLVTEQCVYVCGHGGMPPSVGRLVGAGQVSLLILACARSGRFATVRPRFERCGT